MLDSRLLGTWRSDTRRTMRDILARRDITPRGRKVFRGIFGNLELRYSRTRVYSKFRGSLEVNRYNVLGKDEEGVAIQVERGPGNLGRLYHIRFDEPYYWICLGKFRGSNASRKRKGGQDHESLDRRHHGRHRRLRLGRHLPHGPAHGQDGDEADSQRRSGSQRHEGLDPGAWVLLFPRHGHDPRADPRRKERLEREV